MIDLMPDWGIYIYIISFMIYSIIIVPHFGALILTKFGNSERFWFLSILFLNVYLLLYVLVREKFRKGLSPSEKTKILLFVIGYLLFISPIWMYE